MKMLSAEDRFKISHCQQTCSGRRAKRILQWGEIFWVLHGLSNLDCILGIWKLCYETLSYLSLWGMLVFLFGRMEERVPHEWCRNFWKDCSPAHTSNVQSCEIINVCCLKPLLVVACHCSLQKLTSCPERRGHCHGDWGRAWRDLLGLEPCSGGFLVSPLMLFLQTRKVQDVWWDRRQGRLRATGERRHLSLPQQASGLENHISKHLLSFGHLKTLPR